MKEVIVRYEDNGYGNVVGEIVECLIRCKDCKYFDAGYEMGCALDHKWIPSPHGYCSWAERREENA